MMQDFPRLCGPEDKIGFTMLDRDMCFTCVKNNLADAAKKRPPDCALSCEADIYATNVRLLTLAGVDVQVEPPEEVSFLGVSALVGACVVLQPSFGISLEEMKSKVKGKVRISKRSSLVLDGDVTLDSLELDGALACTGAGTLKDKVVKNAGRSLAAIPEADLPSHPASLQIRGYELPAGEVEEVCLP